MRTIQTTLYNFDELEEQAKQYAIEHLKEQCYGEYSECYWDNADDTIQQATNIAHVHADIGQSSQGFYIRHSHDTEPNDELTDRELFDEFRNNYLEQYQERVWCDDIMRNVVSQYKFDEQHSYVANIGWLLYKFCDEIYNLSLDYLDEDNVCQWIELQGFEFLSNGKVYQQINVA